MTSLRQPQGSSLAKPVPPGDTDPRGSGFVSLLHSLIQARLVLAQPAQHCLDRVQQPRIPLRHRGFATHTP